MAKNSKSRLFTPSVVRRIISSNTPVTKQTAASLSGSVGKSIDRTFKLDGPGQGIKSTQQLNVDWSKFENHTFFNSAEAKVNVAFDTIINNFPFDGTREEVEDFFNTLTGYEKYVYDTFPKNTGCLNFLGSNYVDVVDKAGALFPSLSKKKGNVVLDPSEDSISFETHIFLPSGEPREIGVDNEYYNGNQVICQKLDALGLTGFTLGLLDSRLKNKLIQEKDSENRLLWKIPTDPPVADDPATPDVDESFDMLSAEEAGFTGAYDGTDPARPSAPLAATSSVFWSEEQWAEFSGYEPVLVEEKSGLTSCDLIFLASSGSNYLSASMEIPRGQWSHICATYDREPGQNNIKLYLNGELESTSAKSYNMATFSSVIDQSLLHPSIEPASFRTSPLTIGTGGIHFHGDYTQINEVDWGSVDASHDGVPDDRYSANRAPSVVPSQETDNSPLGAIRSCFLPTEYFSGSLDNFRVWHSTRTEDTLRSTMKSNVYAQPKNGLKLSYTFNEPAGEYSSKDLILDSSGNSLHARISNFLSECKDDSINLNPANGTLGDPDDVIRANIPLEKPSMNPVLFPSYPDIISFNKDMLDKAAWYDTNNPNIITNLIPKHYLLEGQSDGGFAELFNESEISKYQHDIPGGNQISAPQIMKSLLFTWARYFDEIKMFLDHFSNLMNVDYDSTETIPDNFLPFLSNYYGIKLPKTFTDASLDQYLEGENITPDQGISELSLQFVQNQIWRRILVNINEVLHSKGTIHGIRSLMLSMGISPDKLFRFREYGGSRTKTLDDVRKKRAEVSSMLDFSGTLAGVNNHREAQGNGNPFAYIHRPLVNPWEADFVADELGSYTDSPFITPFIMSPFLSGSRVEVGACNPDTNIPVATATLVLDYTLPDDSSYADIVPRHRESAGFLADEKLLDKKAIYLKDIDKNEFTLQFKGADETQTSPGNIVVDIRGVSDRIDISQKLVEAINEHTTFQAYNISELNDGIVSIQQPRGGRAGNYPIQLLQYIDDKPEPWNGLIQAVDEFGNKLWKRPDDLSGIVQVTDLDENPINTIDAGVTFTTAAGDAVYQIPLSEVGFDANPQVLTLNALGTAEIGVWRHITTGELITYEDHPGYADTVFSDNDMGAPYEPLLTEQSEDAYALENGYVPVYNRKEYFSFTGFSSGLYGMIDKEHPDLSESESLFIKENGNAHGFNQTRTDGLFTSGSWTAEAIYKFDKPQLTFYPVTQSLMRLNSTVGPAGSENHVLLANLVCLREPKFDQETGEEIIGNDGTVKLYLRPELSEGTSAKDLVLEISGVNIFDGQKWNISYGRERADQINSEVSSSYFLRVARNGSGEVQRYIEDKKLFLETLHSDNKTFWSDVDTNKNDWGTFITIGSQSLPQPADVLNLGLNNADSSAEQMCTHFSGEIAQLRFWSKALSTEETKEHCRNPLSIGVQNPTANFNFATTPEGSFERLRLDVSFDQPVTASIEDEAADDAYRDAASSGGDYDMSPLGWIELFDFSQAEVSGSRGALWRQDSNHDPMKFHMYGYGFEAEKPNIKPERFDYQTIDAKFDEQSVDNKVRVRGFQLTHNIEEFQTDVAPVYEILPSEIPSDDTRFSIDVSAVQGLNDDIAKIFATLESLDNIIGSPELVFTQSYPDLEFLREVYFNRLEGKVRIKAFFEFFKWFDNAVGDIIKTLVPRKTHFLGVNFVVESHMLERAKMTYNYSDVYLGEKNRHGLKGTMTLQQFVGKVKRF